MEAAGYNVVLVETVGVGQSEVAVAGMVDTFLMLSVAGTGDQLQGIKKGILELADVVAVNKADGDNAGNARVSARDLSIAMKLVSSDADKRRVPVLTCSSYTKEGLDDVWQAIVDHRAYLEADGSLQARRIEQQREWLWNMVRNEILESLDTDPSVQCRPQSAVGAGGDGQHFVILGRLRIDRPGVSSAPGLVVPGLTVHTRLKLRRLCFKKISQSSCESFQVMAGK